jgi:hypothetical protein
MKIFVIIFCSFHITAVSFGQHIEININSKEFYRLFDGFLLKDDSLISRDVHINDIRRLSDHEKLKKMGLQDFSKPYMFLSTSASPIRELIYEKAAINSSFQEINLPIILNKEVITYYKYGLLDRIDTSTISAVKYLKPDGSFLAKHPDMPLGAIAVETTSR